MDPKVDRYINRAEQWQEEQALLRSIVLDSGLTEEFKWGHPCYTLKGRNVVLIHAFKGYCALLFMKGALLKDDAGILVQQTKDVQAARQLRFTSLRQLERQAHDVKAYVLDAIAVEQAGLKVERKGTADFAVAEEFADALRKSPALKHAFHALTPGRQRAYLLHFSSAKLAKTREARIEKARARILEGKGLDDRRHPAPRPR